MNWDQVEGNWRSIKGKFRQKWGKLTKDDVDTCEGRRERIVGKLQARYGDARHIVEKKVDDFIDAL